MNSMVLAERWTRFLASRPEFRPGQLLIEQFDAGEVTRLCDCGCNSYDFRVAPDTQVKPLAPPSEVGGMAFELEFRDDGSHRTVSFRLCVDNAGNLAGLDVEYCGNSEAMPQNVHLVEQPFHIRGVLANEAQPVVAADSHRRAPPAGSCR